MPEARHAKPATIQTIQTMALPAEYAATIIDGSATGPHESAQHFHGLRRLRFPPNRRRSRAGPVVGDGRVVEIRISDRNLLDRLGEQHVLRVDLVVPVVLGDLELVAERDRVERARKL